jgi:multiple sugar transport system ATP-binding protein
MAEVTYTQATRIYPGTDRRAVDALDLKINEGELMVLVGPSGSGKTTALRMLAGLEELDEGKIEIGGRDVTGVHSRDRDIAMVFQNYALYPSKTVAENMGFALKMHGVDKDERERRVREAAKLLSMEEFLDRKPRALSGGQRQRVAMGRAIVREPQTFLMDEPLSNLDAKLRVRTRAQIAELQQRLGVTTVYVTHDQVEAMTLGDRVAVLEDGHLQQCDTPEELYDNPVNAFVAGFIGSPEMNLNETTVEEGGARLGEGTIPLPREIADAASQRGADRVLLGVRPEHVAVVDEEEDEGLPATVTLVEALGADSYVHAKLDSGEAELVARYEGRSRARVGDAVRLRPNPDRLFAFDPETGERLGG